MLNLAELLASDISTAPDETVVAGILEAKMAAARAPEWTGELVAELKRRGFSWSQLVKLTGVPQTTLARQARPYLSADPAPTPPDETD